MPPRRRTSFQLARLFGIRVGVSGSWFFVLFILIYWLGHEYFPRVLDGSQTTAYLVAVAAAFGYFVSLILHELGHALVARRLGIGITGIDLWFFGGLAQMTGDTDSPGTEFKVAVAGPAVTLVIVAICLALSALISQGAALEVARLAGDAEVSPV